PFETPAAGVCGLAPIDSTFCLDTVSTTAMPVISTPVDAVGPRPGSCTLTRFGPGRMSAIANLPSVPVTAVRFFLAPGVKTVTFAPATGSPAGVRRTPVHAGADG